MRIIRKSSRKKKIIIAIAAVVLLSGGYLVVAAGNGLPPFAAGKNDAKIDYSAPTDEQKESGDRTAEETKNQEAPEPAKPGVGEDDGTAPVAQPQTVAVDITAANQAEGQLQVRAMIKTVNTGTCALTLSHPGAATVTQTAGTQQLASTSTCKGFNIPTSNLAKGSWKLTINFKGANVEGNASRQITIQ